MKQFPSTPSPAAPLRPGLGGSASPGAPVGAASAGGGGLLAAALDQAGDLLLLVDRTGRIVEANAPAAGGVAPDRLAGRSVAELLSPEEDAGDAWWQAERPAVFEATWRGGGGRVPVEVVARPVEVHGRRLALGMVRDISRRRESEAGRRQLSLAVEQSPVSIMITDLKGAIEYVNPRFIESTGFTLEEVRGRNPRLFKSGRTPEPVFEDLWRTITRGWIWRGEIVNRRKSGELHLEQVVIAPVHDAQGRPTHYVAFKEDITERKEADEALRKLSRAIEQAPQSVMITSLDGAIEYVNPAFTESTGYTLAEVAGRNPRVLKSGETPPETYAAMWQTLRRGQVWRGELSNRRKDGQAFSEFAVIAPVNDERGRPTHFVAVKEDITAEKRTAAALRRSEERYRLIAENTSDVIWLCRLEDLRFTYVSPAVERLLGVTPAEVVGQEVYAVLSPGSAARIRVSLPARLAAFAAGEASLRNRSVVLEYRHRDGRDVLVEVVTTILTDSAGRPEQLLGVSRDVTERERAAEELREGRDRLAKAEQMARVGNWAIDARTSAVSWSEEMYRIFEWEPGSGVTVERCLGRIHPEDRSRVRRAFALAWEQGRKFLVGHRLRFGDGRVKFVELGGELLCGDAGAPVRMIGTLQDVTERKAAEFELHELVKVLRASQAVSLVLEQRERPEDVLLAELVALLPGALRRGELARAEIRHGGRTHAAGAAGPLVTECSAPIQVNGRALGLVVLGYVGTAEPGSPALILPQERDFVAGVARTLGLGLAERETFAQLRHSEERFRTIFDHAAVGMFETGPGGRISRANLHLARLLAVSPAELTGRHWSDFLAEERPEGEAPPPADPVQRRWRRGESAGFWGLLTARPELDAAGRPAGFICLLQDTTTQVAARETLLRFNAELEQQVARRTAELAATNREVQALLQANPDLVLRLRPDGRVLHYQPPQASPALAACVVRTAGADGVHIRTELLDAALAVGRRALAESTTITGEVSLAAEDGPLAVELRAAPVSGEEFVAFVRDITARKRLEQELAATLVKEREVSEMKTRFISMASHEFRTPMAAIMASVEVLSHHLDRLTPEKRAEISERINQSLRRMSEMLDDVLMLNRMDAGRTSVRLAPLEIDAFVAGLIDEVRLGDPQAHRFEYEGAGAGVVVTSDRYLLHPIISNLLTNAVRYSPPGTVVSARAALIPGGFRVEVRDRGIGIPPEDRARIFNAFERGSNVGQIKGTGLGLNIVKRMAEMLGGTIALESAPGEGSCFTVTFPLPPPSAPAPAKLPSP